MGITAPWADAVGDVGDEGQCLGVEPVTEERQPRQDNDEEDANEGDQR